MISCTPVTGLGEIGPGEDLATLVAGSHELRDGDVLVVTSKVVSKAEARVVTEEKSVALAAETDRVVARRGPTTIVRTRHGLVMAAAGIDASNTTPGTLVLLPLDPDGSARLLRESLGRHGGPNVAVVVSDTSGRAWRTGQTDIAVGAAGLEVLDDHAGLGDGYGNTLSVTAPAVADEITAMADLATGKLSRSPAAVVRGLDHLVLPRGEHGPGARVLVRPEEHDMFGYGAREAVLHALTRTGVRGFGAPATAAEVAACLTALTPGASVAVSPTSGPTDRDAPDETTVTLTLPRTATDPGVSLERALVAAYSLGWCQEQPDGGGTHDARVRFVRATP